VAGPSGAVSDPWRAHVEALGEFIRSQRQLAKLSLRDVAQRARVSNPYLSQVERGLHEPSVRVLAAIAAALDISTETLLTRAGLFDDDEEADATSTTTSAAIRADEALTTEQKEALLAVYRSYVDANRAS
jgi:transcriptional regulator with XRE-family HTH domain